MTLFWQDNLKTLHDFHPDLFNLISVLEYRTVGEIIPTPAGIPTLRFHTPDGNGLLAYSTQNPWNDAAVHLQTVEPDSRGLGLFVGMGLGYGPLLVLRECPTLGMVVIIEPNMDLFVTALKHVDLRPLLASEKVHWLIGETDLTAFENIVSRIASLEDTHILRHVPSFQWHSDIYEPLNHRLFMIVNQLNASGGTTRRAGEQFFRNRLDNLSLLRHSADLGALKDLFAGKPAVLVAAGPSLDRSMSDLKKVAGRCILFAVDSALAPLLRHGIMPDFVTSIDFMSLNFEKLAPFCDRQWPFSLISTVKVTPLIPKRIWAKQLFLAFNDDVPQSWIYGALGVKELAPPSFSVAHLSLGVALIMGCDPIVFIGQDLGYTTADADHADGTIIMLQGLPKDREIFHVQGIYGSQVATDRGLMSLQKRFEDIIGLHPGRTFYNATVAGAHIQGTEPMPLGRIAEQHMAALVPVGEIVERKVAEQARFPIAAFTRESANVLKIIRKVEGQLTDVLALSKDARREIVQMLNKGGQIRNLNALPAPLTKRLSKFDRINKALDAGGGVNEHILELTYPVLSENDRWRVKNEELKKREGYLVWLLAELERIDVVNRERQKAFALYRDLLQKLTRRLMHEEEGLRRLGGTPTEKDYLALARLYVESADYQLARGMVERALALAPSNAEAHLLAGEVWTALLDFAAANEAWRAALRLSPELAMKASAVKSRHEEFWIGIADEHGNAGEGGDNFAQLLPTWLGRVAEILADEEEIPDMLRQLWQKHAARMKGWLAIGETGNVDLVLQGWESLGERFPELLVFQAHCLAMKGDPVGAIAAVEKALVLNPNEALWLAFLARQLLEAGRFEEGIARLRDAVSIDPGTAVLWEEIGDTLGGAGDVAGAAIAFEHCYLALPDRLDVLLKLGDCYFRSRQPEAAMIAYEAVLNKSPDNESARLRMDRAKAMVLDK